MTQRTARTGPSGLLRPLAERDQAFAGTVQKGLSRAAQFESALAQLRAAFPTDEQPTLPESVRFSIKTAKTLAEKAPDLYPMSNEVAARFHLIATFLDTALDETGGQA